MGLLDRFKNKGESSAQEEAYRATPHFYQGPDGNPFGAFAIAEATSTILPKAPQDRYGLDDDPVSTWKAVFVSTTKGGVVGDLDYATAIERLEPYAKASDGDHILVRELSLQEMESIVS